ncbi:MAG: hypothetical protein HY934_02435 [Candidatus Firestonebacteria bacterium]|nr:hypothetical protein [Candidatus Firestonebacteria bacterium]
MQLTKTPISVKRASELTHTMYEIEYLLPKSLKQEKVVLKMSEEQELLRTLIEKNENFRVLHCGRQEHY